jgi:hypothetical protein
LEHGSPVAVGLRGAVVITSTHDPEAVPAADGEMALEEGVMTWVRRLA